MPGSAHAACTVHLTTSHTFTCNQDRDSGAHLHFLKVVNLVGSCLNDLESLVAAEFLRQTLESIVADSQLS